MNKLTVIILGSLLVSSMALADYPADDLRKDRLMSKLELTAEQKQPVADILKEQWRKGKEIRHSAFEQVRPQMEALHEETKLRLTDFLTEKQLQKYDELSRERNLRINR